MKPTLLLMSRLPDSLIIRLREHFQLNCDVFGETDPAADAELIALLIDTVARLATN